MKKFDYTKLLKPAMYLGIVVVVLLIIGKVFGAFKSLGSIGSGIFGKTAEENKATQDSINAAKKAANNKNSDEPTPTGFNPQVWATKMHNAMDRFGTDTKVIEDASKLPYHCRAAIFAAFGARTYYWNELNLYEWLVEELDKKEVELYLNKWAF